MGFHRDKKKESYKPDGQIRQSQLVTTFGPGAMVDLVQRAVVISGLEHWGYGKESFVALDDARLRRSLIPRLKALDPNLDLASEGYFRMSPECEPKEASPKIGVKALEFPAWFVCQGCRRLARARDAFEEKSGRYIHQCASNKSARAVPVRFVAACYHGHLSDFPWVSFCHEEGICERPELYLTEGAAGDMARIIVECRNCKSSKPLSKASVLPFDCRGERPWLGGKAVNEPCDQKLRLLGRTASNAYFPQVVSALRLPEADPDPLLLRIQEKDVWKAVQKVTTIEQLQMLADLQDVVASAIQGYSLEDALKAVKRIRNADEAHAEKPLRSAEYERFMTAPDERPGSVTPRGVQFAAYRIPNARANLPAGVSRLVVVPELREVRVQVSFTRFDSVTADLQGEFELGRQRFRPASLTLPTGNEKWLPAAEVRGEGVFFELDLEAVAAWEKRDAVQKRAEILLKGFEADGREAAFPGVRFYLLHSLSHLLLTAISLECGYAASASIAHRRERIPRRCPVFCYSPAPPDPKERSAAWWKKDAGCVITCEKRGISVDFVPTIRSAPHTTRHPNPATDD